MQVNREETTTKEIDVSILEQLHEWEHGKGTLMVLPKCTKKKKCIAKKAVKKKRISRWGKVGEREGTLSHYYVVSGVKYEWKCVN